MKEIPPVSVVKVTTKLNKETGSPKALVSQLKRMINNDNATTGRPLLSRGRGGRDQVQKELDKNE